MSAINYKECGVDLLMLLFHNNLRFFAKYYAEFKPSLEREKFEYVNRIVLNLNELNDAIQEKLK